MPSFKHVVIVSDNIRGHYHQSLGVAEWLGRLGNVEVDEPVKLPQISSLKKFLKLKLTGRKIPNASPEFSKSWLHSFGISWKRYNRPETLFISAGSSAAPFCLALAKATGNKSAVIMTPSVFGTKPFDFAIVPEHDEHDILDPKIMTTLGAPNHIYSQTIQKTSEKFFENMNFKKKVIAVLVGGSDANYKPDAKWASEVLGDLTRYDDATILITTSRRTEENLENEIENIFASNPSTGYLLILSRNPKINAVTALLGAATHVLVTEDSVSMVSEAVTAGFKVGLLRVPRVTGAIKKSLGYGTKRFDDMFEKMKGEYLIDDLGGTSEFFNDFLSTDEQKHHQDFNEAKRAAQWILDS